MRVARLAALALLGTIVAGPLSAQQTPGVAVATASTAARATAARTGTPTFYKDVLPILQQNCQSCHQSAGLNMGGMVAPFPLVTYDDVRRYAGRVASAVRRGYMPPWSAAEWQHGMFEDERFLEEDEKQTIFAWVEAGSPAGNPSDAPPMPSFVRAAAESGGWSMGEPDLILEFAEPYCLNDDLRDLYVNIPVQITAEMLPEDKWIESVEYRNGPAVHHIISSVGGLVPGMSPHYYPEGYGRVFRAGPRQVLFNMHFNKEPGPGTALCTNIQAGIRWKKDGEVIRHVTSGDELRIRGISIPPGNPSYSASTEYTFAEDAELLSFMPHMHLRGKAALYEITYPDGKHETLLHVPKYDFNWQHTYDFRDPPKIPKGSVLRFTLWWDNSEGNPANPDPTATVTWGLPTHAEMSQGYMSFQSLGEVHYVVGEPIPENLSTGGDNEAN